jgi:hypothetical protein
LSRRVLFRELVDFGFFLGINLFFCQDRQLKFSVSVWFRISWNLTKFQVTQKTFRWFFFLWGIKVVWMSWNFVRFLRNPLSSHHAENLSFLSWKTKKVLFLKKQKKYEVYQVSRIVLFSTDRWPLDVLTFLIQGLGFLASKWGNLWLLYFCFLYAINAFLFRRLSSYS